MRDDNVIYAQVLLLDGKIEGWKVCQDRKRSPLDFSAYWKRGRIQDYTMETKVFKADEVEVPDRWTFNSYIYVQLAPLWISQFEYADDYKLSRSKVRTLDEHKEEMESLQKSLNGRFKFVEKLGEN